MPAAKIKTLNTTDVMRSEEGNDSLDTFIRQAIGKEPFLSFSRVGDSQVQWIQLLHALDQQDVPGWPLLAPLKVQMQKCEKCSQEFCSSINYRRHIRVHHRLKKTDKDSTKDRDLLGAFWDKLAEDKKQQILSINDVILEGVSGSSILKSLTTLTRKSGLSSLPLSCLRAGSALLDVVQARASRFPLSSSELFGILDDASEKTFLCGTAISMQKYVFDGEIGKIALDAKNVIACVSFLVEQKLVKAWVADKDAEALRCQKLLVEEEEAAQKRQAELVEKKKQKRLRQKEQKAKEQRRGENENQDEAKESVDELQEAVSPAESDQPLGLPQIETSPSLEQAGAELQMEETSCSVSEQACDVNPDPTHDGIICTELGLGHDLECEMGSSSTHGGDVGHGMGTRPDPWIGNGYVDVGPIGSPKPVVGDRFRPAGVDRFNGPPKQRRHHLLNGFHSGKVAKFVTRQNYSTKADPTNLPATNGSTKWSEGPKRQHNGDVVKSKMQKVAGQSDGSSTKKHEVLIGSISVTVGDNNLGSARNESKNVEASGGLDCSDPKRSAAEVKLLRPMSQNGNKEPAPVDHHSRGCEDGGSVIEVDQGRVSPSRSKPAAATLTTCLDPENVNFSVRAARSFLSKRWEEAVAGDHVKLVLPECFEQPGCTTANHENHLPEAKSKLCIRTELGMKYIPKQSTVA